MSTAARRMAHSHISRHPGEAARVLERLAPSEIADVLVNASTENAATLLARFAPALAGACMASMPTEKRSAVLVALRVPIAAALLRPLNAGAREEALSGLPERGRVALDRALSYPDQSAGALADPSAVVLHADLTLKEALARVREHGGTVPAQVFVLDRSQRLVGAATPGMLLSGAPSAAVGSLELEPAPGVAAGIDAATLVGRELLRGPLAVVDTEGTFLGVIDEETLRGQSGVGISRSLMHPAAAIGELYWLGLREIFGGFSSGSRARLVKEHGEADRANG